MNQIKFNSLFSKKFINFYIIVKIFVCRKGINRRWLKDKVLKR